MEEKPWGHEVCWNALPSIHGKVLYIKKGHRTSFKYHERKDEVLFVLEGKLKVTYADEEWLHYTNTSVRHDVLSAGESFTAQASCPYRIEALDDSKVIEIGNNSSSPTVRIQDDYGRETEGKEALSSRLSSKIEEV